MSPPPVDSSSLLSSASSSSSISGRSNAAPAVNRFVKQMTHAYRTFRVSGTGVKCVVMSSVIIALLIISVTMITVLGLSSSMSSMTISRTGWLNKLFHQSSGQPTIFVSLASYRDPQCHKTIKDMYEHSEYPDRVYVGIYQQHGEKEDDCLKDLEMYDYVHLDNIKVNRVHFSEGLGPTVARYHCTQMFDNQDFFFQLDSHMRFIDNWDTVMVDEAHNCTKQNGDDPRVILSHYPLEFKVEDDSIPKDAAEVTTKFCNAMYNSDGIIQPLAGIIKTPDEYMEVPFAAAGVMWGPGSMMRDVPYDPDLPYLFHGEELMYSVRLYSSGYRMFGPRHNTVFHFYNRPTFPKVWVDAPDYYKVSKLSVDKVKRTLLLVDPNSPEANGPLTTFTVTPEAVLKYYDRWQFNITAKTAPKFDGCGG